MKKFLYLVVACHLVLLVFIFAGIGLLGVIGAVVDLSLFPLVLTPIGISLAVGSGKLAMHCSDKAVQ